MGAGTDVAMESADVVLMNSNLMSITQAVMLSRKTLMIIKQNLFWAFAYNVVLIPVAAGVLYPVAGVLLSPILASGAMTFSSISVIMNALRLRMIKL
jgi:Cu+-exporting ATPase